MRFLLNDVFDAPPCGSAYRDWPSGSTPTPPTPSSRKRPRSPAACSRRSTAVATKKARSGRTAPCAPGRLPRGLRDLRRGRLGRPHRQSGPWRHGHAEDAGSAVRGDDVRGQRQLQPLLDPFRRRLPGPRCARQRGAEEQVPAEHVRRHLGRLHVSDRTACRHRPGHHPHQGRAAGRRFLQDQRDEDLHHRRRAGPHREHHSPGAGQAARRAGRFARHLAVPGAEVPGRRRRRARRTQRGALRLHRAQDGDQGLGHLRDELRRRQRLAGRRSQQGPGGDVHHDELRAPVHRHPGHRLRRDVLPERRRLRPRAPAKPRADRPGGQGQGRRPDHRAPRRAPHAAHHEGADRGRPRLSTYVGSSSTWPSTPRTRKNAARPKPWWPC